jgi:hypothetical protein
VPLHAIELNGLDAANLLGYMAALGTLRTLTLAQPDSGVRMSWTESSGVWMPVVHSPLVDQDALAQALECGLGDKVNPAWELGNDLTIEPVEFRRKAEEFAGSRNLRACEFVVAFGSDGCLAGKKELIADTDFRTMSGAGHQHFLGFMRDLHEKTTGEHLRRALFHTWEYEDDKPSMRWDLNDYRPHALRATDPSTDPIRTVRGANRLALEALPLFPTMPRSNGLRTTGFDEHARLSYPVWEPNLDLATIRSLIGLSECVDAANQREKLDARGVRQVYRARRFTEGKYRNFRPSEALL